MFHKELTHSELVEIAYRWLMGAKGCAFAFKDSFVAATSNGEQPDAIGFKSGGVSILVECKVSRADFMSDKGKRFRVSPELGMGAYRYFMAPKGLIRPDELPARWGLVEVSPDGKARQVYGAKGKSVGSSDVKDWHFHDRCEKSERSMMYAALRRIYLRGELDGIYESPFKEGMTQ